MEIKIERPQDTPARLSMILWGEAGSGKTTLAATAPGRKLFLLFDPDGDISIRHMPDWKRADLSGMHSVELAKEAMKPDPFGIEKMHEEYDTLVVDSLTKFAEHALHYAVNIMPKSTILMPGLNGYGARNTCVGSLISNLLRITGKQKKNIIFTTHERDAERNDEGNIVSVSMMLGGQLPNITSKDLSEVWNIRDQNGRRYIAVRPERFRSPMKTRMFETTSTNTNFEWKPGMSIAAWWEAYTKQYVKQPLPR